MPCATPWTRRGSPGDAARPPGRGRRRAARPRRDRDPQPAVTAAGALLVSDYGRGTAGDPRLRAALADRARRVPLIWDPHPRGPAPVPGTRLATPNQTEAAKAAALPAPAAARPVQAATAAA